jgi:hypothetical protein
LKPWLHPRFLIACLAIAALLGSASSAIGAPSAASTPVEPRSAQGAADMVAWVHQFGTAGNDSGEGIALAEDAIYVAGSAIGSLDGAPSFGAADAFVRKYDLQGKEIWTQEFGSDSGDFAAGIAADATGVYVVGTTFNGLTEGDGYGVFVRKYDSDGNAVWTQQFDGGSTAQPWAVAVDPTGVYVAGFATYDRPGQSKAGGPLDSDAFVVKYDLDGNELWMRQIGTEGDEEATGLAVDATGVYVVGYTNGAFSGESNAGAEDAFMRKYDASGNELWTHQFGSEGDEEAKVVVTDSTGVYVGGWVKGTLPGQTPAGAQDAFVSKYDHDGNQLWARQFGADQSDNVAGLAVGPNGIYVGGRTGGILPSQSSSGGGHLFISEYDPDGNEHWTHQFGTPVGADGLYDIAVGADGVYAVGTTTGAFAYQTNAGKHDVFVAKIAPQP